MAFSICLSVKASTRAQSVLLMRCGFRVCLAIGFAFTFVCSPGRNDPAVRASHSVDYRPLSTLKDTESDDPNFLIVPAIIDPLQNRVVEDPSRIFKIDRM